MISSVTITQTHARALPAACCCYGIVAVLRSVLVLLLQLPIALSSLLITCNEKTKEKKKVSRQKQVYLVPLVPKTGTFQNQVQITRPEPCDWLASHRTCFWLEKARYTWFCLLCLAFNCFGGILSRPEAIHWFPDTYHTTSDSNGLTYGYTY